MNSESGAAPAFDLGAVGTGVLWGLGIMLLGAIGQGLYAFGSALSPGTETFLSILWQALGSLLGGFLAARRAAGSGWLHGAAAGMALVLSMAAVMGVASALPTLAVMLKLVGIGTGVGALGGIFGVNVSR